MALVLRATNDNGVVADLDLRQDVDLKLDISAIENTEIGRVFGVSTQTFALPDTSVNNKFFGNLFDLGTTPSVALQDSIPCQLLQDGVEVMQGKMYIVDITTNQKGKTFYNVNVINETLDFRFKIENADNPFLAGLDWSEYDHICNYYSITGSWYNQPLSGSSVDYPTGSIIYPHVNYGITPNTDEPQYGFGGQVGKIDNSSTPLTSLDFKPAIRIKDVVDKIFDTVDYKYSSSFFESDFFKNLYMLSTNNEEKGVGINPTKNNVEAYKSPNQDITASLDNTPVKITFDTETFDNGNSWDTGTSTYTANSDGLHKFATFLTYQYLNITIPSGIQRTQTLEFWVNGSPYSQQYVPIAPDYGQIFLQANIPLNVGDTVEVYLTTYSSNPVEYCRIYGSATNTYFLAESPYSGNQVNMGSQFPSNLKMMDFLSALIEKFNLVIEPDRTERDLLIIEPYETWLNAGVVKDWSDKVDRSIDFKIIHPITEQPKTIYFSDEEDDDILTKYTKENFGRIYGDYYYTTESDLANGERKIGRIFAPCPVKGIDGGEQFVIPHMCRKEANEEPRPFRFKPRLIQAIGLQSASLDAQGYDENTSTSYPGNYWMFNEDGSTAVTQSVYYAVGALSSVNNNFDNDTTLHFNSVQHYDYQEPFANGHVKQDAFQNYWATYLNSELYDIDSRKLTCNIYLQPSEYFDFQLNDNIFIDGHYYRINKIAGGNLSKKASVEVELIKVFKRRLKYPRKTLTTGDIIVVNEAGFSVNGSVTIVNDVTGATISGSRIGGYANQLGLATYPIGGGDVQAVWNYNGGSNINPSAKVSGNNDVSSGTTNTLAMGNSNTIQSSTNGIIVGDSNSVGQLSTNVTAIGNSHTAARQTENIQFLGGNSNSAYSGSTDSTIVGGGSHEINASSLVTIVGGASNTISDSITSRNVMLGGLNATLSSSQDTVVINSDGNTHTSFTGNTLIGDFQSSDAAITGSDYRFNNTLVNGLYVEEDYYTNRHSYQVQAYSGSTDFAYSGNGLFKYIYEVDFDTAPSGSGVGEIELPTIVSQDQIGRTILFKASDNINSGSRVDIVSFGDTDDIEGSRSYRLERPGQWVELRASQYNQSDSFITEWRVIRAGIPFESSVTNEGAYGSFYSTQTQAIATSGSAQLVTFNNTFTSNLISLSGSAIELDYKGAYSFTWTAKVENADNVIHYADFWVKYNGADYPNSTVRAAIPARKNASEFTIQPVTVQLLDVAVNNGDKIELYWRGDSTLLSLQYETFGGTIPAAPSIRATIHAV